MPLPPFGITIVVYLACGGVLWLTAHLLAPIGYQITLGRAVGCAILMSLANAFLPAILKPQIGDWYLPAIFLVHVVIAKSILWLPFWRSLFTVIIYWVVLVGAVWALFQSPWAKKSYTAAPSSSLIVMEQYGEQRGSA